MVSPAPRCRPWRRAAHVDLAGLLVEEGVAEETVEVGRDAIGIGDDTVAHAEGTLGGFDQAVDVLEALALGNAQARKQAEDDERGQALRRRRRVVQRAGRDGEAERRVDPGAVLLEIGAGDRATEAFKIGGHLAPDIAAIEVVEPGMRQMLERFSECALLQPRAFVRWLAVSKERLGEAGHVLQVGELVGGELRLAARDDIALARMLDGGSQQHVERQPAAMGLCRLLRQHPAGDGAWHGQRGKRAARRHLVVAGFPIKRDCCLGAGAPGAHQRAHAAGRLAEQPKAVAADMVHVRIDGGNRGSHRQHRLDGVAALGEDGAAVLDGGGMRRADDAVAMAGGVEGHGRRPLCRMRAVIAPSAACAN